MLKHHTESWQEQTIAIKNINFPLIPGHVGVKDISTKKKKNIGWKTKEQTFVFFYIIANENMLGGKFT